MGRIDLEFIGIIGLVWMIVVLCLVCYVFVSVTTGEAACRGKYGSDWSYRSQSHEASLCVNSKGEAKYL